MNTSLTAERRAGTHVYVRSRDGSHHLVILRSTYYKVVDCSVIAAAANVHVPSHLELSAVGRRLVLPEAAAQREQPQQPEDDPRGHDDLGEQYPPSLSKPAAQRSAVKSETAATPTSSTFDHFWQNSRRPSSIARSTISLTRPAVT